jgi:hypothetical protein
MALVANPLPNDTLTIGKTVAYFDPTADMAGLKYGTVKSVAYGVSGTDEPITVTVTPEAGGSDVVGAARFFRVVDKFVPPPARRPNV